MIARTLGAGVHRGPLVIEESTTIRGEPGAVLDADGAGSVVSVSVDDIEVRIEGVTLRGGHEEVGGGVSLTGYSKVTLHGCVVTANRAPAGGGGAAASRGELVLSGCTFSDNAGRIGADVLATGVAQVRIEGGAFAGDVAAREGAVVTMDGATVEGKLDVRGTTTRAPNVTVRGGEIRGGTKNDAVLPGMVVRE